MYACVLFVVHMVVGNCQFYFIQRAAIAMGTKSK